MSSTVEEAGALTPPATEHKKSESQIELGPVVLHVEVHAPFVQGSPVAVSYDPRADDGKGAAVVLDSQGNCIGHVYYEDRWCAELQSAGLVVLVKGCIGHQYPWRGRYAVVHAEVMTHPGLSREKASVIAWGPQEKTDDLNRHLMEAYSLWHEAANHRWNINFDLAFAEPVEESGEHPLVMMCRALAFYQSNIHLAVSP